MSGKVLVLAVLAIFGPKIHCLWWHYMVLGCFWSFSSKPFIIFCQFLLFELSLLFKNGQWQFLFWQKNRGHFGPFFRPKFGHFCSKIRVSDIFFESAHQICLKLGQKLGTIALNHRLAVLCLGKFLFWLFWPFLGQKYIACGDIIWFWSVFGHFLPNRLSFFVNFCYLR